MKTKLPSPFIALALLALATLVSQLATAHAQGTAFTYQGRLNSSGSPANGSYDLAFRLFATNTTGVAIAGPVTNNATAVTNGLFTTTLDFGAGVFTGGSNWLEIAVSTNGANSFAILTPRQQVTPTPYAIFAGTASNVSGTISAAQLPGSPGFTGTVTATAFAGNGANVTNVNAVALNGLNATNFWQLSGNNVANGQFLGSTNSQPVEIRVNNSRAFRLELNADSPNVIGGASINTVSPGVQGATIAGGGSVALYGTPYPNRVDDFHATIGGGLGNWIQANAFESTIAGGNQNQIQKGAFRSFIGGGYQNTIQTNADDSTIGGGYGNTIQTNASMSTIGGGNYNTIQTYANDSTIGGGVLNTIQTNATYSTIGGGFLNTIQPGAYYSAIGGGVQNTIQPGAHYSAIAGGVNNVNTALFGFIGGGDGNFVQLNQAVVSGGYHNSAVGSGATVSGGAFNSVMTDYGTIAGGYQNTNQPGASDSTIGGGYGNTIQTNASYSTIGGGWLNTIQTNASVSTIGGGSYNTIQINAPDSTIGGGSGNTIQTNAYYSAIGGGYGNTIQPNANDSTIGGGIGNTIQTGANDSTIGGGNGNTIQPNGQFAMIPGGQQNLATNYAFAAGNNARATNTGAFVWSDSTGTLTASTNANSVTMRASGGFRFFTGTGPVGASLAAGGTAWGVISDRNAKKNFQPLDGLKVLEKLSAIPVQHWNYKWEPDDAVPHIGPMAQDFKSAFYPGRDDKSITTLEFDGVELAAIQGLNQKLEAEVKTKNTEIESLKQSLAELKQLVQALAEKK